MDDFLTIKCPGCETVLIVNRREGNIVEVRKPIIDDSSGNRFADAELKVKREKDTIAKKFEEAKEREKNKMDRLNALFDEGMKKAKDDGEVEKFNPFELD